MDFKVTNQKAVQTRRKEEKNHKASLSGKREKGKKSAAKKKRDKRVWETA